MEEETTPGTTSTTPTTSCSTPMKETNEDGQATTAVGITTTAAANNDGTSEECQIEQGIEVTTSTTTRDDTCNVDVNNDNNNIDNLQKVSSAVPVVEVPPIRGVDREEELLKDIQLVWPRNKNQTNVVNGGWTKHQWDTSALTRSLVHHGIVLVKGVPTATRNDGGGESTLFAPSKEDTITIGEAIADVATEWWTNTTSSFWNNNRTQTQQQQQPKHTTTSTTNTSTTTMLVLMMIYHDPNMIVMARRPKDWKEADEYHRQQLLNTNHNTSSSTKNDPPKDMWIIHSIVNPVVCKFRLSGSMIMPSSSSKSMELITPHGNMIFTTNLSNSSELPLNENLDNDESNHLEEQHNNELSAATILWETILTETLMEAHNVGTASRNNVSSYYERHQILLGTLHSNVVLRDTKALEQQCVNLIQLSQQLKLKKQEQQQEATQIMEEDGPEEAHNINEDQGEDDDSGIVADLLNARDVNGYTALQLACFMKSHDAIKILVDAGADVTLRTPHHSTSGGDLNWYDGTTICHVCAILLDLPSLRLVLAAEPRLSNALDCSNRTPIHVMWLSSLSSRQRTKHIQELLEQCTNTIGSWGGQLLHPMIWNTIDHPIHTLCSSSGNKNISSSSSTILNMLLQFGQKHKDFLTPPNKRLQQQQDNIGHSPRQQPQVIQLDGTSLSAFCQYPIHTVLLSLRDKVLDLQQQHEEEGTTVQDDSKNDNINDALLQTLQVLLQNGFEPNERIDYVVWGTSKTQTTMHSFIGFAPLHIIALMALELQHLMQQWMSKGKDVLTPQRVQTIQLFQQFIVKCSELLVSYGARINVGAIVEANEIRAKSLLGDNEESMIAKIESLRPWNKGSKNITPSQLNLEETNIKLWALLGGKERLVKAYSAFSSKPTEVMVSNNNIFCMKEPPTGATATDKQQLPGSNNDVSCAICWSKFGTFSNRKHWCRTTHRHVCDSCSTKRLKMAGLPQSRSAQSSSSGAPSPVRITDGQYNLARYLSSVASTASNSLVTTNTAASHISNRMNSNVSSSSTVVIGSGGLARSASQDQRRFQQEQRQQRAAQAQQRQSKKETQEKEELFGNVGKKMANLFGGSNDDDDDPAKATSSSLSSMMSTLEGTRDALNERGTKLSSLSEKSSALADASKNFADMAKQLERQQRGGGGFFDW